MDEQALLAAGPARPASLSSLLPPNTHIFSSNVRFSRWYHTLAAFNFLATVGLLAAAIFLQNNTLKLAMVCAAVSVAVLLSGVQYFWRRQARAAYELSLARGEWQEGVIVFPSGDVVVRFQHLFSTVDRTIEAAYLSRAEVERRFSLRRPCGGAIYLNIYYLGIDAKPQVLSIRGDDLKDDCPTVADNINDAKARAAVAPLF